MRAAAGPRFDRRGFPLDPQDRAARRSRLRSRALTTTVVATVVAAPVLALWAAYRGAPLAGDKHDTDSVAAAADGSDEAPADEQDRSAKRSYEQAGSAQDRSGAARLRSRAGASGPDVTVEVIGVDGKPERHGKGTGRSRGDARPDPGGRGGSAPSRPAPGPGRLTVEAQPSGDVTVITLSASGGAPVRWSASASGRVLAPAQPHRR